jgi:hypothetical protein
VKVLDLDDDQPFTAARGRNAGAQYFAGMVPGIELVQFVDGDCELVPGWLERASTRLRERPDLAAVCGRIRERSPGRSIYNRLCDIEWNTPIGEALACGGNAMMRLSMLQDVGGFNPELIAGEEPELCLRLRRAGYRIERLDADMVLHDAAMTRFVQWWRRSVRAGHAYAEGASMHGAAPERHWVHETRRIWFWGAVLPGLVSISALSTGGGSALLLWAYPFFATRLYAGMRRRGFSRYEAFLYGVFLTVGRFAELEGMLKYHLRRWRGEEPSLIEYKRPAIH